MLLWRNALFSALTRTLKAQAEFIREELPQKVASVVADMLNADCECRKRLVEYAKRSETERLSSLTQLREMLVVFVESAYSAVTRNLMREFRIFTASNAIAFALLGVVTLVRIGSTSHFGAAGGRLAGAVVVTGGLYLFNQNWLHSIVFGGIRGVFIRGDPGHRGLPAG